MRILMIDGKYGWEHTRVDSQCHSLANQLQQMGVQVDILSGSDRPEQMDVNPLVSRQVGPFQSGGRTCLHRLRSFVGLFNYLMRHHKQYDVLHSHGFLAPAGVISRLTGLPLVQKITNLYVDDPLTVRNRNVGYLLMYIYRSASAIVASSKVLIDICHFNRQLRNKTISIPNGVDTELYRPATFEEKRALRRRHNIPEERLVLLVFSSADTDHGIALILKAMRHLQQTKGSTPILLLVETRIDGGVLPHSTELAHFSETAFRSVLEWNLQESVRFETVRAPMHEYMKLADVYLHPFNREIPPNGLLEAMSCGLPVIAHLIPDLTDGLIPSGRFAFMVDCEDSPIFAAALHVLTNNIYFRQRVGRQAREEILQYYDIKNIAAQYLDLYVTLLQGKHLK